MTRPNAKVPTPEELQAMLWQDRALEARQWVSTLKSSLSGDDPLSAAYAPVFAEIEEWTAHICDPAKYREFYQGHRGVYVPMEQMPMIHDRIPRLNLIRHWLMQSPAKSVLDLACFDGFALVNLCAALNAVGHGVDLDGAALAHAEQAAKSLRLAIRFTQGLIEEVDLGEQRFDAVLLMEILEHVVDPTAVLRAAERHLAPGGTIYITVPATAVDHQGNAHEAREHLRVLTGEDFTVLLADRVVDQHEVLATTAHGERVLAYRRPRTAFYVNPVGGGWAPEDTKSYGGSEEMVLGLARACGKAGHEVEVFGNFTWEVGTIAKKEPPADGGVYFKLHEEWQPNEPRDIVVVVKHPPALDRLIATKCLLFWSADPNNSTDLHPLRLERVHKVVGISKWHEQELVKNGIPHDKATSLPLALSEAILGPFPPAERPSTHCVYASSFDRGLPNLLTAWPQIRAEVPEAVLHVWYGWDLFDKIAGDNEEARKWKALVTAQMQQAGVVVHERTTIDDPTPYLTAAVWAYPCVGGERFCLTAIKAQRLGAIPVVTPVMALHETVRHGLKCEQSEFIAALVFALKHPEWQEKVRGDMMHDPVIGQTWADVERMWAAKIWTPMLHKTTIRRPRRPATKQQKLSACLITYNAEGMLIRLLKGLQEVADEIIVADQGSTDSTREILRRFGVTVVDSRSPHWCLVCDKLMPSQHYIDTEHEPFGFEGPRNDSIRNAAYDWILWIDSDEALVRGRNMFKYLRRNVYNGYAIRQHHFSIQPPNAFKPDLPVRCFRNGMGTRFYGKVHEHPEIEMNKGVAPAIVLSDVDIAHDGYYVEDGRRVKFQRNIGLMRADRRCYPDRTLGAFLWLRDLIHLTRYDLESSGGVITPSVAAKCQEGVRLYEEKFLGEQSLYAFEGLDYYSEALRILNIGFEVLWAVSAAPFNAQPAEPKRARFSGVEQYKKALAANAEAVVAPFTGKYV